MGSYGRRFMELGLLLKRVSLDFALTCSMEETYA